MSSSVILVCVAGQDKLLTALNDSTRLALSIVGGMTLLDFFPRPLFGLLSALLGPRGIRPAILKTRQFFVGGAQVTEYRSSPYTPNTWQHVE